MRKETSAPEPPVEIRRLTAEETERAIEKLQRRIAECKGLQKLPQVDQRIQNVQHHIADTILEIFGESSREYQRHKNHTIRQRYQMGASEWEKNQWFQEGLRATVLMLTGLIETIRERAADVTQNREAQFRSAFSGLELQPRIAGACSDLFRDGHYRNAVLDASLALENFVKEKSRRHDLSGATLMRTVFSKTNPIVVFNELSDQSEQDEQEGLMHLFEGAMLALRNPRAHSLVPDSPVQALDYIALLDLLARRLDQSKRR
jgi:uncharacterized protein (TIGR02391 family)